MSGGKPWPASRIKTLLLASPNLLAIRTPETPEPTIRASNSSTFSSRMSPPLPLDEVVERQRFIRPVTEAQFAVAHGMRLCDAPGPSLRIGSWRDDFGVKGRRGRRLRQHRRLIPGSEIPSQDDAASEIFYFRVFVIHDVVVGTGRVSRIGANNLHQALKCRVALCLLEENSLDLERIARWRQQRHVDAGQRGRELDDLIEV